MTKYLKTKSVFVLLILSLAAPVKANAIIIGAPILVVQAIASVITFFASSAEYRPTKLVTVNDHEIHVDSQAFKKKSLMLDKYLFYQCQNWDEKKVIQQSELLILQKTVKQLEALPNAKEVFGTHASFDKTRVAIFLFAMDDFSNTHIRKASFGGPFKKQQWSTSDFAYQLRHKGCKDLQAYNEVKAWSDAQGFPFFL